MATKRCFSTAIALAVASAVLASTVSISAAPLIEESFDYSAGALAGSNGGTGFAGSWSTTNVAPTVAASGLSWGSLTVAGNSSIGTTGGGAASRDIGATSALDTAGLMGNGDTLWFSALVSGVGSSGAPNIDINFTLGSDAFITWVTSPVSTFPSRFELNGGEGIGFAFTSTSASSGRIDGAYWQGDADTDTFTDRIKLTTIGANMTNGSTLFIVGSIQWGATDVLGETITLYAPDTNLNLGSPVLAATLLPALDQSTFDTVAFQSKSTGTIDEIRFGASSVDVMPVPEPSSLALLGVLGLGGLCALRRRRNA